MVKKYSQWEGKFGDAASESSTLREATDPLMSAMDACLWPTRCTPVALGFKGSPLLATGPNFDPLSHPLKPKATDVVGLWASFCPLITQSNGGTPHSDVPGLLRLLYFWPQNYATALLLTSQTVPSAVPILLRYCSTANFTNCFVSSTMCS